MSKGKNSPNASRLAGIMAGLGAQGNDSSGILDFGEIGSDKSLICNSFPIPIPKGDYLICKRLTGGTYTSSESGAPDDTVPHTHTVTLPGLAVGDRVLVAWVGNDAVVIDVIINADTYF